MAPAQSKQIMFADEDDNIMVEAVVNLLNRGVDSDDVFRMVRRSDWDWQNESIPLSIVRNRNLYDRIVKLAQKRGRNVFAPSSFKNRFKWLMNDPKGIAHVISERTHLFRNEITKKRFQKLYRKWHIERKQRACWGRSRGGSKGALGRMATPVFDLGTYMDSDQSSDGENRVIVKDENTEGNGNPPPVSSQPQPDADKVLLNSTERQAIIKTIALRLQVYPHQDVLIMVMADDWSNGSNLHAEVALRAKRVSCGPERPYQKYWKEKVVPLMLAWNMKINPCFLRINVAPVYLTQQDLFEVRGFVVEFKDSFAAV